MRSNRSKRSFLKISSLLALTLAGCATTAKAPVTKSRLTTPSPLEKVLSRYESLAAQGGWGIVVRGGSDKALKNRLLATGDLTQGGIAEAVLRFQERHGLEPDGVVGTRTLAALNVSIEDRIQQLKVNSDRLKRLKEFGSRSLVVNIPDFRLKVVENGKTVLERKVIVGQKIEEWQTPPLSSAVSRLILNPKWNVPPGIFEKELIQLIREDPDYLADHNMKVLVKIGNKEETVDPAAIDWQKIDAKKGEVRLVQVEGDKNSLGKVKFLFPNRASIYLHDTPDKKLFAKGVRALSHGCVRVEGAIDLAEYLMRDDPNWTREKLLQAIATKKNQGIALPSPVVIHIIYLTAWVDEKGVVHFREDIYDRDL